MRDAARERADTLEPLRAEKLLLKLLPFSEIKHEADPFIGAVLEIRSANEDGDASPIFAEVFFFKWRTDSTRRDFLQAVTIEGAVFGRRHPHPVDAPERQILARVTYHSQE